MKLSQARKMRDGLLKGDTVMAQAWKELISGDVEDAAVEDVASSTDRGSHTAAALKRRQEQF